MYVYENEKAKIFTDQGQRNFLKVKAIVDKAIETSGAVMMQNCLSGVQGDTWLQLAYVDRLVELGEIREITGDNVAGQNRVFVRS